MLKNIIGNLQTIPHWKQKKYLLAFSGGIDSVVLAIIFKKLNLNFSLAHCNFKLRGEESDQDQEFVEKFAKKNKIHLFVKVCDLSKNLQNTQLIARHTRYEWFNELLLKYHFDYLSTAHHLNDSIETFFINLLRTSGLKGLTGIKNSDKIIRPMKEISKKEIETFAKNNYLQWREDSSNALTKYQRNYIRHKIIPVFEKIQPSFIQNMQKTLSFLQQNQNIVEKWFEQTSKKIIKKEIHTQILDIKKFLILEEKDLFLYYWLSPYGFSDWGNIKKLIENQSGKYLSNHSYRLIKHQNKLLLEKLSIDNFLSNYIIQASTTNINKPFHLSIEKKQINKIKDAYKKASKKEVFLDYETIKFPLSIRKWKAGDTFYPLGMTNKKKLSDFFKDEKMSLPEKEKIWLICDAHEKILWIVGKRPDNRFKITKKTLEVLHLKLK